MPKILVGTRKGLFYVERGNKGRWGVARVGFLGEHVTMLLADPRDGALYAATGERESMKLLRSRDNGESWEECAPPTYPKKPEDEIDSDPVRGTPVPWSVEQVWSLEWGGVDEPGVLWCGTIPGGLFRSPDAGVSWEISLALWNNPKRKAWFGTDTDHPGIHSICVDPRDGSRVLVGVSCGGVWETRDTGATWECRAEGMWAAYVPSDRKDEPFIQDPHRMVMCRKRPECLWAQHRNGVFRSTDGAASWKEIGNVPPSNFGFAAAVHPRDPEIAWLVPATSAERRFPVDSKMIVTRTRDGGKTFDLLRRGLPQEHAYHLVDRHALDVDASGDRLAMGSTTGGLWVSEDQGDAWSEVTTHLPPIACVRFQEQ